MAKIYLNLFLKQFIQTSIPKGAKSLIVSGKNVDRLDSFQPGLFDYVVLDEVLESASDIQYVFEKTHTLLAPDGKLIIIFRNFLQPFLKGFLSSFLSKNTKAQNWLSSYDVKTFLQHSDFEHIIHQPLCFIPFNIPVIGTFFNFFLLHFFPFNHFSFLHFMIAQKVKRTIIDASVSIIVPAKNESGNIEPLFQQLPVLHSKQEVIFVIGASKDDTRAEIERNIQKYSKKLPFSFIVFDQIGQGKAQAVWQGFAKAKNDVLMILDSDLTVKPLELIKFYRALTSDKGEFINGSRLVYPMESNAMQFLNILGNKFFSILYTFILGQNIKDTLCGTKVLWRKQYQNMQKTCPNFFIKDPFGDFALLTGASKLNLKIVDLPVRYFARNYGSTNIKRFQNAFQLMIYSIYALEKLKLRK